MSPILGIIAVAGKQPAGAMEAIAWTSLSSNTATVTFSSIPQTYQDLMLIIANLTVTTSTDGVSISYNNDTGTNYSYTTLYGTGSATFSKRGSNASNTNNWINYVASSSTVPGVFIVNIMNYANTNTNKTSITRSNNSAQATEAVVNLWRSTAAINQIDLKVQNSENFLSGTTFALYGVKASA